MSFSDRYRPSKALLSLGDGFYDRVLPAEFPALKLRFRNQTWARRVGLDTLGEGSWRRHFGRLEPLPENLSEALALRYHGHQFRQYNPLLGDGCGFLLGQLEAEDGRLLDLGTKGSGRTPWSGESEGRLSLKDGVREVLAAEMLEALGVCTSKALSLFETGQDLCGGSGQETVRACVLVRLNHSHVRFGSFSRCAHYGNTRGVKALLTYCTEHLTPGLAGLSEEDQPVEFMREVCHRSAELAASWMVSGFVHGLINTENMNVTGESFEHTSHGFLPRYDENFVAGDFDTEGLFKYGDQHLSVIWNLSRLAEALSIIAPMGTLGDTIYDFLPVYMAGLVRRFVRRLGLMSRGPQQDSSMVRSAQDFMAESGVGFDQFFFDWYGGMASRDRALGSPEAARYEGATFSRFRRCLRRFEALAPQRLETGYFRGAAPCTLLKSDIDRVWDAVDKADDWRPFDKKVEEIRAMKEALGLATR
jgi:uncharacterized protein YdiU (UPF0061 family)